MASNNNNFYPSSQDNRHYYAVSEASAYSTPSPPNSASSGSSFQVDRQGYVGSDTPANKRPKTGQPLSPLPPHASGLYPQAGPHPLPGQMRGMASPSRGAAAWPQGAWPAQPGYPGHQNPSGGHQGGGHFPPGAGHASMASRGPPHGQQDFHHGPTELPPRPYRKGEPRVEVPKQRNRIPESAMEFLPHLEDRVDAVEGAIHGLLNVRAKQALDRSKIVGLDEDNSHNRSNSGSSSMGRKN